MKDRATELLIMAREELTPLLDDKNANTVFTPDGIKHLYATIGAIDDFLKEPERERIDTYMVEGLIRQAYDKGLSQHITNLTVELYHLPEKIKAQAILVFDTQCKIEDEKAQMEIIKLLHLKPILNNKELSNQQKRDIALEDVLKGDSGYQSRLVAKGENEILLKRRQIEMNFLQDSFSAYKAIAGTQKRSE